MRTTCRRVLTILSGLSLTVTLTAGCAMPRPAYPPETGSRDGGGGWTAPEPGPPAEVPTEERGTVPDDPDTETEQAVEVVNAFWTEHWGDYFTGTYQPPRVYGPYDESTMPVCGGEPVGMGNALFCPDGYIAWDAAFVAEGYQIDDVFGPLMVAHEEAHAVQDQIDPALVSEARELMADCMAGAALAGAVRSGWLVVEPDDDEGLVKVFDALGDDTPWQGSGDHGTAEQRVEAFNIGVENGVDGCLPATA